MTMDPPFILQAEDACGATNGASIRQYVSLL